MPPLNEAVWVKLFEGEGFWHIGMLTDKGWWISGKHNKPVFYKSVAGWAPWR